MIIIALFILLAASSATAQEPIVILGRPTDVSMTANVHAERSTDVRLVVGTTRDQYTDTTEPKSIAADVPLVEELKGLRPDTRYYYRLQYRTAPTAVWTSSPERFFQTQRARGKSFTFLVEADEHLYDKKGISSVFETTLRNELKDSADFLFSLGDTFGDDHTPDETTSDDMRDLHRDYLKYFGMVSHSMPFFFCLGNHEGEMGYYLKQNPPNNIAVYGTLWRKYYYSNPVPNAFYTGNLKQEEHGMGLPENYYAFEWGDALFVVLDVYRHCDVNEKPQNWDWTLGADQYEWFRKTLSSSKAKHKFVFAHHVRGQGRGAATMVKGFEWGGYETKQDRYTFEAQRPGWEAPIHQLMVKYGVNAFFQGHDHLYATEVIDGIMYQEVPMPSDSTYEIGVLANADAYTDLTIDGSGYLRVNVSEDRVVVDYVRTFLPQHETAERRNGEVKHSYTITPRTSSVAELGSHSSAVYPLPADGVVRIANADQDLVEVIMMNAVGEIVMQSASPELHVEHLPNGIYSARIVRNGTTSTHPVLIQH